MEFINKFVQIVNYRVMLNHMSQTQYISASSTVIIKK